MLLYMLCSQLFHVSLQSRWYPHPVRFCLLCNVPVSISAIVFGHYVISCRFLYFCIAFSTISFAHRSCWLDCSVPLYSLWCPNPFRFCVPVPLSMSVLVFRHYHPGICDFMQLFALLRSIPTLCFAHRSCLLFLYRIIALLVMSKPCPFLCTCPSTASIAICFCFRPLSDFMQLFALLRSIFHPFICIPQLFAWLFCTVSLYSWRCPNSVRFCVPVPVSMSVLSDTWYDVYVVSCSFCTFA